MQLRYRHRIGRMNVIHRVGRAHQFCECCTTLAKLPRHRVLGPREPAQGGRLLPQTGTQPPLRHRSDLAGGAPPATRSTQARSSNTANKRSFIHSLCALTSKQMQIAIKQAIQRRQAATHRLRLQLSAQQEPARQKLWLQGPGTSARNVIGKSE